MLWQWCDPGSQRSVLCSIALHRTKLCCTVQHTGFHTVLLVFKFDLESSIQSPWHATFNLQGLQYSQSPCFPAQHILYWHTKLYTTSSATCSSPIVANLVGCILPCSVASSCCLAPRCSALPPHLPCRPGQSHWLPLWSCCMMHLQQFDIPLPLSLLPQSPPICGVGGDGGMGALYQDTNYINSITSNR
jgi:hypothetical protein